MTDSGDVSTAGAVDITGLPGSGNNHALLEQRLIYQ